MIEVKEGIDLDRAIAGAIGIGTYGSTVCLMQAHEWDKLFGRNDTDTVMDMPFMPSSHLDAAFAASEVAGLFNNYRVLRKNRHHWEVYEVGESLDRVVSTGDTPALAICAAILKTIQEGHTTT
mgnify:FL=1